MVNQFSFKIFLNLIRSVFPRWNFFDQTGFAFEVYIRPVNTQDWIQIEFIASRSVISLFYNAEINESLAHYSLVEHFSRDAQEQPNQINEMTTFNMMKSLIEFKISEKNILTKAYQFKIEAVSMKERQQIYESHILTLETL